MDHKLSKHFFFNFYWRHYRVNVIYNSWFDFSELLLGNDKVDKKTNNIVKIETWNWVDRIDILLLLFKRRLLKEFFPFSFWFSKKIWSHPKVVILIFFKSKNMYLTRFFALTPKGLQGQIVSKNNFINVVAYWDLLIKEM